MLHRAHRRSRRLLLSTLLLLCGWNASAQSASSHAGTSQPVLGHRSVPLLTVDGLSFKDLDRNGVLDVYEDWRQPPEVRAADLVKRMELAEAAGLMVHGTLPSFGAMGPIGMGTAYDLAAVETALKQHHVAAFITRLDALPAQFAQQNNAVQELAERTHWGVPATISSDPRHQFTTLIGASVGGAGFSRWPNPTGLAAIDDEAVARSFGEAVRQEFKAVGIRESLAPQADLATEPRWARIDGTFGEDPAIASRMLRGYITGVQNGVDGLNAGSVIAVVKHWAGYGAARDGWDGHNAYGRFAAVTGDHLELHLRPFEGAFEAHVASVMPTYVILKGALVDSKPAEPVGAGFSRQLLTGLLRGRFGFKGVVLSDWAITNDCNPRCETGAPPGAPPGVAEIGMPWGVETLSVTERIAKSINAGVDQLGGTERSDLIVEAVHKGLLPEARVRESAQRILTQTFALGLFEQPFVDEAAAARVAGSAELVRQGVDAQTRAVVLLKNAAPAGGARPLLPIAPGAKRVLLYGIDPKVAMAAGFTVASDPAQAELAIVRAPAPFASQHPGFFFGSRQHEGRLFFTDADPGYAELLRVSAKLPTIFVTTLERPLILTNTLPHATALLGDFGIGDEALLRLLTGKAHPAGHLPFELPSSVTAVEQQKSDLPHDSKAPLFPIHFGLSY